MSTTTGRRELTVRQAARRARRAEETIRRWIWSGRLPARKRGHTYVVLEQDLDATLAQRRPRAERPAPGTTLGEWLDEVERFKASSSARWRGSASDLVLEDRRERSDGEFATWDDSGGR
jgi:excisionase family DNA binding protein